MVRVFQLIVLWVIITNPSLARAGATFDAVKARGQVTCGVNTGVAGFSTPDARGNYQGLDADFCRAIAAALFGDASKVRFIPTTYQTRFVALQSGEIDVLARNVTQTLLRDTSLGFVVRCPSLFRPEIHIAVAASRSSVHASATWRSSVRMFPIARRSV